MNMSTTVPLADASSRQRKRQQQAAPPPLWTLPPPRKRTYRFWTPYGGRQRKAEHTSSVDFAFHAVIMDPKESVFEEVRHLPEVGVATLIETFMAYKGHCILL